MNLPDLSTLGTLKKAYYLQSSGNYVKAISEVPLTQFKTKSEVESFLRTNKKTIEEIAKKRTRIHLPYRDRSKIGIVRCSYSHDKFRQHESNHNDPTVWQVVNGDEHIFIFP